tara:strand:+ start:833 stop:1978 length:1146 start_codon:yes stop_codon:yes gene_type:complete
MALYYPSVKTLFHSQGGAPAQPPLFSFTSYKFEYANAVGRGTDAEVNQNWNQQSWYSSYFTYIDYTNQAGCHSFVIPATGTYTIRMKGAAGGQYVNTNPNISQAYPGEGAYLEFDYPFTQGDVIAFVIGRVGGAGSAGTGGGGGTYLFFRDSVIWTFSDAVNNQGLNYASSDTGLIAIAGGGGGCGHGLAGNATTHMGHGKGGSSTTDSNEVSAGGTVAGLITNGSAGNNGIGYGGSSGTWSSVYGIGAGGGGWKGVGYNGNAGNNYSGVAEGGGRTYFYSSGSPTIYNSSYLRWYGGDDTTSWPTDGGNGKGGAGGGRCCAGGGGGGYTGGGGALTYSGGTWGSGGGGGSYVDSAATNVTKTAGADASTTSTAGYFELIA